MSAATPTTLLPGARVHFVGIGGAGMSALAQILLERGHAVSGSDLVGAAATAALGGHGATIAIGHHGDHIGAADVVVVSNAVAEDNPEVVAARAAGRLVLPRADLLAAVMAGRQRILVAGTHGKTTTTSMITAILRATGHDPSFAIGGVPSSDGIAAHHGDGLAFVAEADEAYGSFLRLEADCAVVTNIDYDHHDFYPSLDAVVAAFAAFCAARTDGAPVVACADDEGARELAASIDGNVTTYGTTTAADVVIEPVSATAEQSEFRLIDRGTDVGVFTLPIPGLHNVRNATAAIIVARWLGVSAHDACATLWGFGGVRRRFESIGAAGGVRVVDDYAHHPTEVAATLAAARQVHPSGRIVAVFQPHLYSRTAALGPALGAALGGADVAVVTPIYGAREAPVAGVDAATVAAAARAAGVVTHLVGATDDLEEIVAGLLGDGDLVLTLGAGDVTTLGPRLLSRLSSRLEQT